MADDSNNDVLIKLKALDQLTPVMIQALQNMEANSAKMAAAMDRVTESTHKSGEAAEESSHHSDHHAISFIALKEAADLVFEAFEKVEQQFEKAIEESLQAEKSNTRLTGALVATGQYTGELNEKFEAYAKTLRQQTGLSEETTKNIMATGIQMGLSTDKAQNLVVASQRLAAATGTDVNSAFTLLQASLAGHSRGLDKVLPQVKQFGAAQLSQGAAIDLVNTMLKSQGDMYQQSFAASLDKGKSAINEVYKEFGNIITQSPIAKQAMAGFVQILEHVAESLKTANDWLKAHSEQVLAAGAAFAKAAGVVAVSLGIWATAAALAVGPTAALGAVTAVLFAPVTLITGAVIALAAAFYKWPGTFDVVAGAIKTMLAVAIAPLTLALAGLLKGVGYVIGVFNKDWGDSISAASSKILDMNINLGKAGIAQAELGVESIKAGNAAKEAGDKAVDAAKSTLEAESELNNALLKKQNLYDGMTYGTEASRKATSALIQDRDNELKNFTAYLDAKERLAISKAEEQRMAVQAINAKAIAGSGGGSDGSAQAQLAIDAEIKKQAQLDALHKKGVLSEQEYNQATLASDQRAQTAELSQALAFAKAKAAALGETAEGLAERQKISEQEQALQIAQAQKTAAANGATLQQQQAVELRMRQSFYQQRIAQEKQFDQQQIAAATAQATQEATLLGNSPAGQQKQLQLADQKFKMEEQQKKIHAMQAGLSQKQIDAMAQSDEQSNLAAMKQMKEKFIEEDMAQNQLLGNNWQVSLDKIALAQEKFGTVMGTLRGVQQTQEYKGTMDGLNNLASLRSSKSKGAFEVGKAAAIAQAGVQTGIAAVEAYASMASIPFVGPALGIAAAAAAIAAGVVQVQNISSQQFNPGGQADEGMDAVPNDLAGKSFVLSAGERVVQPAANKDLTNFLNQQKTGGGTGSGGANYVINLSYSGNMSKEDVTKMADMIIPELRRRSDRGTPIINSKGVV